MKEVDVKKVDWHRVYLHYTDKNNLSNIAKNGLIPAIGDNSKGIEKTPKIFFTISSKGALAIMDVWFKWLLLIPRNKYLYRLGAILMPKKIIPNIIYDIFYGVYSHSPRKKSLAKKKMLEIIENSVWLVLDLEEEVDFSFSDIDEVKSQKMPKRFLKKFYHYGSNVNSPKMEYWNMHTLSNRTISSEKISILSYKGDTSVKSILKFLISENKNFVTSDCLMLQQLFLEDDILLKTKK